MAATDGSSVVSETRKANVSMRDGGTCVLCGQEPIDVAHIVARKAGNAGQVSFIRSISPSLSGFQKDDPLNLLCLCPLHHRQYDIGLYALVPSKSQREVLLKHELQDFLHREALVHNGQPDPGRSFPHILNEFEYIPVQGRHFYACIHNPTCYDEEMFVFDNIDHYACPLLHFQASVICLMVEAQPHLSDITRRKSDKADAAELDVTTLLKLYKRQPDKRDIQSIPVPASYHLASSVVQPSTLPIPHILPTIPSSPLSSDPVASAPSMAHRFDLHPELPGLTPSMSADTQDSSDTELEHDLQLLEYAKEPAVTWEDLKTRQPLFPGADGGNWQFSSAEQIIRGEWH